MIKNIAFIGATGNLAPFAYNELLKKGINIRALVRNPEKVRNNASFPQEIEVVKADLNNVASLLKGFKGMDAIYLNLSTTSADAEFQPEVDGVKNVLIAAKQTGIKRIFHVSAITVVYPEFAQGKDVFANKIRKQGYKLLNESGIPATFFHLSWIMDLMEYGMHKGNKLQGFASPKRPFYWLAGKDLGKMIANAVEANAAHNENKDYIMQGKEPILFKDAMNRYAKTFSPNLKVELAPTWMLRAIGWFNKEVKTVAQVADFFSTYQEEFRAEQTWAELGEPTRTIENFRA